MTAIPGVTDQRRSAGGRRRASVILGWGSGVWLSAIVAACGVDSAAELVEAERQYEAGELHSAMQHANQALQAEPDSVSGRLLRARIALAAGDPLLAREEVHKAEALSGADTESALILADASTQLGEPEQALALLDAVPEGSRDRYYWTVRCEAFVAAGRLSEAAAAALSAAALGETSRLLLVQGRIASLANDPAEAERLLTRAVELARTRREQAEARAARGSTLLATRALDAAQSDLQAAAEAFAQDTVTAKEVGTWATLVRVNLARGDLDAAAAAAGRLSTRAPGTPIAHYSAALVAYRRGRFDDAVTQLQRAVNRAPDEPLFTTLLGVAQLAGGDHYQAEQQFLHALSIDPDEPETVKLLVETRLLQQRPEAALHAIEEFPRILDDPELEALQGLVKLELGRIEEGVAHLERAVAQRPDDAGLRLELARAYGRAGRAADEAAVRAALPRGAELAQGPSGLAASLHAGDVEAAWRRMEALLSSIPEEPLAYAAAAMYHLRGR